MAIPVRSLKVLGVHHVVPTAEQIREAVQIQWGSNLEGEDARRAEDKVREHFEGLYLLEIEASPEDSDIDWIAITQPMIDLPRSDWQAPYDEQRVGEDGNRWSFFFHVLDLSRPLRTEIGDIVLPRPTPIPPHLSSIIYEIP